MAESPLRPEEYAVYSHIMLTDKCTPTGMARELNMPPQTVSDWLTVMRQRGHLVSQRSPTDGRSYRVELSKSGLAAHEVARVTFERGNALFVSALHRPEKELRAELEQIVAAAVEAHRELTGSHSPAG
jgi:DNA-binding MarR family transcriptional regulator